MIIAAVRVKRNAHRKCKSITIRIQGRIRLRVNGYGKSVKLHPRLLILVPFNSAA